MKKARMLLLVGLASLPFWITASASVAPGYADWTGFEAKNMLRGRVLSASDLRHRVTVVALMKPDPSDAGCIKLGDDLRLLAKLPLLATRPDWVFAWDDPAVELPRKCLVVAVLRGKCTSQMVSKATASRQGEGEKGAASDWLVSGISFYSNAEMINGPDNADRYPYVYVMGPDGTEPLWKGVYAKESFSEIAKIVRKATSELREWTPLTGVADPQHFKKEGQELLQGKPVKGILDRLQKGVTDADAEKAREAQIMYDAIWQYRADLLYRIREEYGVAPARAFVDLQKLIKMFPQEKKNLQMIDAKLKSSKATPTLGKMFEKYMEWSRPDFVFKNTSEAKKAVQLVNTWKKPLEKMSNDQSNAALAGEASLILSQLDGLAESLMTKLPQK